MSAYLHVYGQSLPGGTVFIAGNEDGLKMLSRALKEMLSNVENHPAAEFTGAAADEKKYEVRLLCYSEKNEHPLRLPYTDVREADTRPEAIPPNEVKANYARVDDAVSMTETIRITLPKNPPV